MPGQTEGWTEGQKDGRTEGRTDPILYDPSGYCWAQNTLYIILKLEDSTARKKQSKKSGNSEKIMEYKITDKEGL